MTHDTPTDTQFDNLIILQLEPFDDAVTVRDRLAQSAARPAGAPPAEYALLVWAKDAPVLRRKLDLLLVQRHAQRLALQIALVTSDPVITDHARDLNISVFGSVEAAHRTRWKTPRGKVFTAQRDPQAYADLAARVFALRHPDRDPGRYRWRQWVRWAVFAGVMLAMAIGFLLIAPTATVTVTPASDQIAQRIPVVAVPGLADVDVENYRIPASVIPFEATSRVTIQSSGRETVGASQAQGTITFTNTSDLPQIIPYGTVVTTSETYPIRFETTAETTLPGGLGSTTEVPILALPEHAGAIGNVNPGAINRLEGALAEITTVTNQNATYGGAIQERAIVTGDDHDRLIVLGRQQLLQNARDEILHQLEGEQFLVPGSVVITEERTEWTRYNAFAGDQTESVTLDLRARVQAVIVDGRQARQVAYTGLAPYIEPGLEVSPGALSIRRGDIQEITPEGEVTFLMIVEGSIAVAIDENNVRERVAGMTVSAARDRLEREFILDQSRPPEIETWPGWFKRVPWLPVRISVEIATP